MRPPPDYSAEFAFLAGKPPFVSYEGYLFPDTYRFFRGASPEEIVKKLVANLGRRLSEAGIIEKIAGRGTSLHELLTLASVIEKEVRTPEDRRLVADVFRRRLEIGMALQADSTVNYVTGKSVAAASSEDVAADSPYNTYKHRGLPPGPICNPGLDAISAALEPQANDYWYFLTDADGGVHYAKTLDEHNANKAKYLNRR